MWVSRAARVTAARFAVLITLSAACAAPSAPSATPREIGRPSAPSRIIVVVQSELKQVYNKLNPASAQAGGPELEEMVHAGLINIDPVGARFPQLAEAVPTLDNGLWKLLPDGTMEMTWTIRQGAQWHDGAPFTAEDLLFTLKVTRDRELPAFSDINLALIQDASAQDLRAITVRFRRPLYDADVLFSRLRALPLPRHLLESTYENDRSGFVDQPYFYGEAFIGTGAFRVRQWVAGSHAILEAFDHYVLGRPKIDEIEVRFIQNSETVGVNILSGAVEMTIGRALSLDQALEIKGQWPSGVVRSVPGSWQGIHPQLLTPNPTIIGNVQLREALLRAIDREQMAETLVGGLSPVAHVYVSPADEPYYSAAVNRVPRYDYDLRRASELVESLGYNKRGDGFFYDSSGQKLEVELRTYSDNVIGAKSTFPVADYWSRFGVATRPFVVPTQQQFDLEFRATFPGFILLRGQSGILGMGNMLSHRAPVPANGFQASQNYSRLMSPEFDAMHERITATIPLEARVGLFEQAAQYVAQNQLKLGLFFDPLNVLVNNRIQNTTEWRPTFNVQEWRVS